MLPRAHHPRRTTRFVAALAVTVAALTSMTVSQVAATAATTAEAGPQARDSFPEPGDKIIEGRVIVQDLKAGDLCNIDNVVEKELNPVNVRGCKALDDVKVTAYDSNRNILATGLTYASNRADGPAHGYYYLYVPAGQNYYVEFEKQGYNRWTWRGVDVPKRGRGTRLWAGLTMPDLDSDLKLMKNQRHNFSYCEPIPVGFTLDYAQPSKVPSSYPDAPYGYMWVEYRGQEAKVPGGIKEKFKGRFSINLKARFFSPGTHTLKWRYTGLDYRGTFPDVRGSSVSFTFKVTPCGGAGRPTTTGDDQSVAGPITAN